MKRSLRKLQLSRETLHQMIGGPETLRHVQGGATAPVNCSGVATCQGNTCPTICTVNRPCAG